MQLRVKSATWEAPNILSFDLRPLHDEGLTPFTAGAHIDIALPGNLGRSYSLINPQDEHHRYVIAVQKDRESRGGSKWMHQNVRPGDILTIEGPRNNFALNETASKTVFIAGGIGVTPFISMTERLSALKRDWEMIYCARRQQDAAFVEQLRHFGSRVQFNFDEESGGKMLDIATLVRTTTPGTHLYCCGPLPMLSVFETASADLPREHVHVEYFTAKDQPALAGGFTVVLAKSGREFTVAPGRSILDTLLDAGLDIPHSCIEGVCGTCETKVLQGVPDHRDAVLTEVERTEGKVMMICCSGSKTERLVLDL